jgi:hypothetical protein
MVLFARSSPACVDLVPAAPGRARPRRWPSSPRRTRASAYQPRRLPLVSPHAVVTALLLPHGRAVAVQHRERNYAPPTVLAAARAPLIVRSQVVCGGAPPRTLARVGGQLAAERGSLSPVAARPPPSPALRHNRSLTFATRACRPPPPRPRRCGPPPCCGDSRAADDGTRCSAVERFAVDTARSAARRNRGTPPPAPASQWARTAAAHPRSAVQIRSARAPASVADRSARIRSPRSRAAEFRYAVGARSHSHTPHGRALARCPLVSTVAG